MPLGLGVAKSDRMTRTRNEGPAGVAGPTERKLLANRWRRERERDPSLNGAMAQYDAAEKLYVDGKFGAAEEAFKDLAKNRRATYENFGDRWKRWWGGKSTLSDDPYGKYGDPVEEDARFMVAECQFAQQRYSWAQDSYAELLEEYPSTRHMEESTRRLFTIAMYWLRFTPEIKTDGDVQLASHETINPAKPPKAPAVPKVPIIPNLRDKTRPVFDVDGRALQALRTIWLHDAAGPLADDALMLSANHHLRTGDFVEATRLYKLLREQYPDSPHFQDAHLLGAYVTMASYEGPTYDGEPLKEAKQLKTTALQLFPDLTPEDRTRLQKELDRLNAEEVGRMWDKVEYYRVKRQPQSMEIYCNLIINKYPDSKHANQARQVLKRIKKPVRTPPPTAPPAGSEPGVREPAELTGKIDLEEVPDSEGFSEPQ